MRKFRIVLPFLFLLQSCATTIVNQHSQSIVFDKGNDKSITVRTSRRTIWKDHRYASIRSNKESETALTELLKNAGFKEVKVIQSEASNIEYSGDEYLEKFENKIKHDIQLSESDYFLDIYQEDTQFNPHHGPMFVGLVYFTVHLITLGLVPMIYQQSIVRKADLYLNKKLVKSCKAVNVSTYKTWSPLVFNDSAKKMSDPSFDVESEKIVGNKILTKLLK